MIKNIFGAVMSVFNFIGARSALKNTPQVQKAVEAQQEVKATDDFKKALEKHDINKIRQDLSE